MVEWLAVLVVIQSFSKLVAMGTQCPAGYVSDPRSRKCWKLNTTRRSWTDALAKCREEAAELGVLNNRDDHDFVRSIGGKGWIGVNDRETDYHYVDSLGKELTWTNWKSHPKGSTDLGRHCFYMALNNNGRWLGAECSILHSSWCMTGEQNAVFTLTSNTTQNREDMYAINDVDRVKCSVYCQNNVYCLAFAFKNKVCRLLRYSVTQSNFTDWNLYV